MEEKACRCSTCLACQNCENAINLNSPELVIYQHRNYSDQMSDLSDDEDIILNNTYKSKIMRSEYLRDLRRCRTRCGKCKKIVERVRSLLEELVDFKQHPTIDICEHCKTANTTKQCKRCDYVITKFIMENKSMIYEKQRSYKTWLLKVKTLLQEVQKSHQEWDYIFHKDVELEGILKQLEVPLSKRVPNIDYFPHLEDKIIIQIISESKEMLSDILNRIQIEYKDKHFTSEDSLFPFSSMHKGVCICKQLKEDQHAREEKAINEKELKIVTDELDTKTMVKASQDRTESSSSMDEKVRKRKEGAEIKNLKKVKDDTKSETKSTKNMKDEAKSETRSPKNKKFEAKSETKTVKNMYDEKKSETRKLKNVKDDTKSPKEQKNINETSARKMDGNNMRNDRTSLQIPKFMPAKTKRSEDRATKNSKMAKEIEVMKAKARALLPNLPQIQTQKSDTSSSSFESFIECDNESDPHKYFVKGNALKPLREYKEPCTLPPLVFKEMESKSVPSKTVLSKKIKTLPQKKQESQEPEGFIYKLSNPDFIDIGWTVLPTKKIMRRMNIYKMDPVKQKYNWLERLQREKIMYYDSGEILSKIDELGCGKFYYRNGSLALEYYNAQEIFAGRRFIVYSSGEEILNGYRARTILAIFDYLGNGVIYDLYGNIRLKYNQSEGIVIDPKIGPPARWKWHTLNEPPVIEQVFMNEVDRTNYTNEVMSEKKESARTNLSQIEAQNAMLQIELDNMAKAKLKKMSQAFQPLQIKMKAAKLNDKFSVRILDQSNITLVYRDGSSNFKLNLGMNLNSREIIDSQIFKIGDVGTPYDDYPAKSQSVENIQQALKDVRKRIKKFCHENPLKVF